MNENSNDRGRVKSVEVGLHVLKTLAEQGGTLPLKELAAYTGLHASKVHRYLASLVVTGMVEQDPRSGCYRLGAGTLHLGLAALSQTDLINQSVHEMEEISHMNNETVLLSVWGNNGATIIKMIEPPRPVTVNVRVGFTLPLLSSATGLIFASFQARETVADLIETELDLLQDSGRADTPKTMQEVDELLAQVRDKGMSRVKGALVPGINSLSAPIFDHTGVLAGVLTILGAANHVSLSWTGPAAESLAKAAASISRNLGYDADNVLRKTA